MELTASQRKTALHFLFKNSSHIYYEIEKDISRSKVFLRGEYQLSDGEEFFSATDITDEKFRDDSHIEEFFVNIAKKHDKERIAKEAKLKEKSHLKPIKEWVSGPNKWQRDLIDVKEVSKDLDIIFESSYLPLLFKKELIKYIFLHRKNELNWTEAYENPHGAQYVIRIDINGREVSKNERLAQIQNSIRDADNTKDWEIVLD